MLGQFFLDENDVQTAGQELEAYVECRQPFAEAMLPQVEGHHNPAGVMRSFWLRAPTRKLHIFAKAVTAMRLSSQRSEIAWAQLSRYLTPIRNRMKPSTASLLMNVHLNRHVLPHLDLPNCAGAAAKAAKVDRLSHTMPAQDLPWGDPDDSESSSSSSASGSDNETSDGEPGADIDSGTDSD